MASIAFSVLLGPRDHQHSMRGPSLSWAERPTSVRSSWIGFRLACSPRRQCGRAGPLSSRARPLYSGDLARSGEWLTCWWLVAQLPHETKADDGWSKARTVLDPHALPACVVETRSALSWTGCSPRPARVRVGCWSCEATPESGSRRFSNTRRTRRETYALRADGVESEMELAFAALHQLCAPVLDRLTDIPAPQREALETVFGPRRRAAGSLPGRAGGVESAVGCVGGRSAVLRGR